MNVTRNPCAIFFNLLKKNNKTGTYFNNSICTNDWRKVVRKSKENSSSEMCSKIDYSVHKYALNFDSITEALIRFCNLIIKDNNFLERCLKATYTMIDEGKGPMLHLR